MKKLGVFALIMLCLLLLMYGGWKLSRSRTTQLYGGLVTHVKTEKLLVALTLDDGPNQKGTNAVLPVLALSISLTHNFKSLPIRLRG